jgi:hypothetical protein
VATDKFLSVSGKCTGNQNKKKNALHYGSKERLILNRIQGSGGLSQTALAAELIGQPHGAMAGILVNP